MRGTDIGPNDPVGAASHRRQPEREETRLSTTRIPDPWAQQRRATGEFIRHHREMANMSLRQLSKATKVSNAYLSQIERGMHDPTVRVLLQIGDALDVSLEEMLCKMTTPDASAPNVEAAVHADTQLTSSEKSALIAVYRSYISAHS